LRALFSLAGLALALSTHASANTIWNVNASFLYNSLTNQATGSFTLGPSLNLVTWDLVITGTNTQADNTYTPGDSIALFPNLTHLDFYDSGTGQYVDLYLASPLSTSGGTINLLAGDSGSDSNSTVVCGGCGILVSGNLSAANQGQSTVPEPSSIALSIAGLFLISGRYLRK